jgi:hypothetical protein
LKVFQALIVTDSDPAFSDSLPQVRIEAGAVHVPPVAVSMINAVLYPRLAAPRGSLGVACNVTGATELIPKPKCIERVSNSPGEGFSPPRLSLRRPVQHDSGEAQITESGGEGGPRRSTSKHANVVNLFHRSDIPSAFAIYTPSQGGGVENLVAT